MQLKIGFLSQTLVVVIICTTEFKWLTMCTLSVQCCLDVDNVLACTMRDTNEEEFILMSGLAVLAGGIFLLQGC